LPEGRNPVAGPRFTGEVTEGGAEAPREAPRRRRTLLAAAAAAALVGGWPGLAPPQARAASDEAVVDVAVVFAVDVSRSIDEDEARLQREGYRRAVTDPRVVEAIRGGAVGAIAIAFVEWSGIEHQRLVVPWTRVAGQADADAWAEVLARAPRTSVGWTSISGGIDFARRVLAECPWEATRKVIDVSGDGVNNSGPPVQEARDRAVAEGVTINGLAILTDPPTFGRMPAVPLEAYFRESVVGGPGAFVVAVEGFESYGLALRRKLLRKIAGGVGA
jgi:hypothetical protein